MPDCLRLPTEPSSPRFNIDIYNIIFFTCNDWFQQYNPRKYDSIIEMRKEERKKGRKEEWKNGRMEEWKKGRKEEMKKGRKEERKKGRKEERKKGRKEE